MGASVVVTGANRGIGLATALELASAGYDVIGTARSGDKASALRDAAGVRGLTLRSVLMDVADAASTERGFAEIAELTGGGPWAVVNNAGFAQAGAIEDVDDAALRYQLEVNLVAPARIARLVLPAMRERGEGRIVNMSSIAGRVSLPLLGWYCAAKHGLEAMTDALRMEVAQYGIRVVLVEPGASAPASGRAPATRCRGRRDRRLRRRLPARADHDGAAGQVHAGPVVGGPDRAAGAGQPPPAGPLPRRPGRGRRRRRRAADAHGGQRPRQGSRGRRRAPATPRGPGRRPELAAGHAGRTSPGQQRGAGDHPGPGRDQQHQARLGEAALPAGGGERDQQRGRVHPLGPGHGDDAVPGHAQVGRGASSWGPAGRG